MHPNAGDAAASDLGRQRRREPAVLLGFDPGGAKGDHFGWAVLRSALLPPLEVLASGNCSNARDAVHAALAFDRATSPIAAAAIDAPLSWVGHGGRQADETVRRAVAAAGCPSAAGTVQHLNSLRGACLVGGMMAALELRHQMPRLLLSESHPKALLWLLLPTRGTQPPGQGLLGAMRNWLTPFPPAAVSEHKRDAAIAGLSAWAMVNHPPGWVDLYSNEEGLYSPVASNLGYWMPKYDTGLQQTLTPRRRR